MDEEKFQYRIRSGALYYSESIRSGWTYQEILAKRYNERDDAVEKVKQLSNSTQKLLLVIDPCN